jgi:hypothetical protein
LSAFAEANAEILDLVADLSRASGVLGNRRHPRSAANLADLVRVMNCYYSNLIEGHNTTPREIERALGGRLGEAEDRRNLQIEARAHIRLQREIDRLYAADKLPEPASLDSDRLHGGLFELETLITRLKLYVDRRGLKAEALPLLEQTLQHGELPCGDAGRVTGLKERSARDLLAALVLDGILGSNTPKGPVSLRFPFHAVEILFPSLFPEA